MSFRYGIVVILVYLLVNCIAVAVSQESYTNSTITLNKEGEIIGAAISHNIKKRDVIRLAIKGDGLVSSVLGIYNSVSNKLEASKKDGNFEIETELRKIRDSINKQKWELDLVSLKIQLIPHVEIIKSSMNILEHSLKNPYSVKYRKDFVEKSKGLENSLTRILERFAKADTTGDAYLDVLKKQTVGVGRFLSSVNDMEVLLKGGFAALAFYYDATKREKDKREHMKKYFKDLLKAADDKVDIIVKELQNEDNVKKEMQIIMENNPRKSNREVADLLYNHLSNKYDTKQWLVITYNAIVGFEKHTLWNIPYTAFRHGGKNAAAISLKRNLILKESQRGYLTTAKNKIAENCNAHASKNIACVGQDAMGLTKNIRDSKKVNSDSPFAAIYGDVEVRAKREIQFLLMKKDSYSFLLVPSSSAWTESFMLQSAWNTSLVIDRTQSNELIVSTAVGSPNQLWYIDEKNLIRSSMDDFCLTSKGYYTEKVTVEPCSHGKINQEWTLEGNSIINSSKFHVLSNGAKSCLEIWNAKRESGSRLCEFTYHGGLYQQWNIIRNLV